MSEEWQDGEPDKLKPGMLLELTNGKILLVGHINPQEGRCDCCAIWLQGEIVRWRQIMTFDDDEETNDDD